MRLIRARADEAPPLVVRLASSSADVHAAQALRHDVFYRDMGADLPGAIDGRDVDPYDDYCDHLIVEETSGEAPRVVGTYRLLRQSVAERRGGFYSAGEYDIERLVSHAAANGSELLELSRSCVAPEYRDTATIQLLWHGIGSYLSAHGIGKMFGCASFPGTDPEAHGSALSYLYHSHLAPQELRASVHADCRVEMARLPIGSYDPRAAWRALPPLIKGYLRVGAMVGDGAFVDHGFNTVDVFMIMPVEAIAARYAKRFAAA